MTVPLCCVGGVLAISLFAGTVVGAATADTASHVAVIAHRGAHVHAPENTLPAFQAAVDLGVDYVELDLRTTADGCLVIIHNSTVDARTNGSGAVRSMTLEQIRTLDAGVRFDSAFAGTRIPTADEAFAFMKGRVGIDLDVKDAAPESVVALLRRHDMLEQTVVCDDAAALAQMKRIEPRIRAMIPRPPEDIAGIAAISATLGLAVVGSTDPQITPEVVAACHAAGATVFLTILAADHPEGWSHAVDCRVDALETDRPAELLGYLRARGLHR